jgi:PAS domain S-box-containing protein
MSRFSLNTLRARLLLLVVLAIIPALGLTFYTDVELRRRAAADVETDALRLARIAANDQEDSIKSTRQLLYALGQLPQVSAAEPAACSQFLAGLLDQVPQLTLLGVIDVGGQLVCSAPPGGGSVSLAGRDYFQRAMETRDFAVGAYQRDPLSGKATLGMALPLPDRAGQLGSVVFATLDLDRLNQLAADAQLPAGSTLTLIDRHATILARYPDPGAWVGSSLPEAPIVHTILSRQGEGTAAAYGVDGVYRLFAFTPLSAAPGGADAYVSIGIPSRAAFAAANQVLVRHLLGLGLVTALALAAAWFGSQVVILRWINGLLGAAQRISAGDLSARTGLPYRYGELGQLARAFDDMAAALERRVTERDRAETALRESQRALTTLLTNLPGMAYRCYNDRERSMQFVSQGCLELTGYAPADLVGSQRITYAQLIHPADREAVWNDVQAALDAGLPFQLTYRITTALGPEKWVWEQGRAVSSAKGAILALEGFITDITQRVLTHQLLEGHVAARTRELAALYDVTAVASASLHLDTVLEHSLDQVLTVMDSQLGAIHLLDESNGLLHMVARRGIPDQEAAAVTDVPVDQGLVGWVVEDGQPLVLPEILSGPRPLLAMPAAHSQAYLGVPMRAKGRILGVLSVVGEAGREFTREEVSLLNSIADQVAVAVENARLYQQAGQLAVMQERGRLARDLHDSVTQGLYSVTLLAEAAQRLSRAGDAARVETYLARLGEAAHQALAEMRLMIYELRPPLLEQEGLVAALQHRLDAVEGHTGLQARLLVEDNLQLPASAQAGLYHIAQEALNNALKHAAAAQVTVQLRAAGGRVELEIADDGVGFDPQAGGGQKGMGLANMRERAEQLGGRLTVESAPGQGTRVRVDLDGVEQKS